MSQHWHVLGAGAIGGVFAKRLMAMGTPTTLLTRHASAVGQQLIFKGDAGQETLELSCETLINTSTITHLLVCTKAFDIEPAVQAALPKLTPDAIVVLLANGMGYHATVANLLGAQTLIAGSTTAGCYKTSAMQWHIVSEGHTRLGNWSRSDSCPADLTSWFTQPWSCAWETDITSVLLEKALINAAINPPTALHDIPNGELLAPPYLGEFEAALEELEALVAVLLENAREHDAHEARTAPPAILDKTTLQALHKDLSARIKGVAMATAANTSSMRADYQQGRRTEIEAILGYLLGDVLDNLPNPQAVPALPILSRWLRTVRQRDSRL